jgi:hypothetical protein
MMLKLSFWQFFNACEKNPGKFRNQKVCFDVFLNGLLHIEDSI